MIIAPDIKFNETTLEEHARALREYYVVIQAANENLNKKFSELDYVWQGDAHDDFGKKVVNLKKLQVSTMERLNKTIEDLEKITGIYAKATTTVNQTNESLPTEGIFKD